MPDTPPVAERPDFPDSFGLRDLDPSSGLMLWHVVQERLSSARSYWVCSVCADGTPHTAPVWGMWNAGTFLFSTDPRSLKGRNIATRPAVTVNLESAESVVILKGTARKTTDRDELDLFIAVCGEKYGETIDTADPAYGVYAVDVARVLAWETGDFPRSATRWNLGG